MARASSTLLLICGFLLLVTWLVTPAVSAPQSATPRVPVADPAALPPELEVVNEQVERLRARLERQVAYPEPSRDPFRFAPRARVVREPVAVVPELMSAAAELFPPVWPTLVAILTSSDDGKLQAALSDADDSLQIVSTGAVAGAFTIGEITADGVVINETVSGQSTRLSLR